MILKNRLISKSIVPLHQKSRPFVFRSGGMAFILNVISISKNIKRQA